MAALHIADVDDEFLFDNQAWICIQNAHNVVTLRSEMGQFKELAGGEFRDLIKNKKLRKIYAHSMEEELTQKEQIRHELITTYTEAAKAHPSGRPSANSTVKDVCEALNPARKLEGFKVMAPGTLQNYLTNLENFGSCKEYLLSLRKENRQCYFSAENEELMRKVIKEALAKSSAINILDMHNHYVARFKEQYGDTRTPYCYTTFNDFYKKDIARDEKLSRFGSNECYQRTYTTTGVVKTSRPLERVECDTKFFTCLFRNKASTKSSFKTLTLYAGIDTHTSALVGYNVSLKDAENSNDVLRLLRNIIRVDAHGIGGVPDEFMFDNSVNYTSADAQEFVKKLRTDIKFARKSRGQDKPKVERFFDTLITFFLEGYPGYAPKRHSNAAISRHELKKRNLMTLNEFLNELQSFLLNYNERDYNDIQ